jgi:maleate cis-trans isomerase
MEPRHCGAILDRRGRFPAAQLAEGEMYEDELPSKKVGCLMPLAFNENQPYEFYRLAPPGVILVMVTVGLQEFSREDVERAFKPVDELLDGLVLRECDVISQIGVPLPLLMGVEAYDALIAHIAERTGLPVTSQLKNVIEGLKHLGTKRVLLVNKWSDEMNATLEAFLDREGIAVAGVYNKSLTPAEFTKIGTRDHARLAYDLGRKAFDAQPDADALYIGGGAWLSQPVSEQLEREVGKPVISNVGAMVWNLYHMVGLWQPIPGHGRLLEGD